MILKFDFQRDEVSFFFLLSHPTALPCIGRADDAFYIFAVHELFEDAELPLGGSGHEVLPLFRQDGQVGHAPLDVLFIVQVGRGQLHQMTDAPTDEVATALQIAVLTAGDTEDFGVSLRDGGLFGNY